MFFTFWTAPNHAGAPGIDTPPGILEWSRKFKDFRVFDDRDAMVALADISADLPEIYQRIRIPACRSDLARLALLYRHGGLYTDAHSGVGNPLRLAETMSMLASYEIVLFDGRHASSSPNASHFANTSIGASKRSVLLRSAIDLIVEKLKRHRSAEALTSDHVEYNIADLTGAWPLIQTLCSYNGKEYSVRPDLTSRVGTIVLDENTEMHPIFWYRHYSYRQKSSHWSERQKVERLFDENLEISAGIELSKLALEPNLERNQQRHDSLGAVHEAEFLMNVRAPSQALAIIAPALKAYPENYWVNYVSGRLMKMLNLPEVSQAFYGRAIKSDDPSRIGAVWQLAKDQMVLGHYRHEDSLSEAIRLADETDQTREHINNARLLRALCLLHEGDASGFAGDVSFVRRANLIDLEIAHVVNREMLDALKATLGNRNEIAWLAEEILRLQGHG